MDGYVVLGKLDIAKSDYDWIQEFRSAHDELYFNVVYPHFTLVFPTFDISVQDFQDEVIDKLKGVKPIEFCIASATINKDVFNDCWHVFLVPDQGLGAILKLHDKLYSGRLANQLRLDLQYLPHIGIGNSKDKWKCKSLVDNLNASELKIAGRISTIDIAIAKPDSTPSIQQIVLG